MEKQKGWLVIVYRVPSKPSRDRVAVWRTMKRLGAVYLQSCVCVLPNFAETRARLELAIRNIEARGGDTNMFEVPRMPANEDHEIVELFRAQSRVGYEEVIEECITKFEKEITYERGRSNFTFEESEEIAHDLDKIKRWFERVSERDWFDAGLRTKTLKHVKKCERLLEAFEAEVYKRTGS